MTFAHPKQRRKRVSNDQASVMSNGQAAENYDIPNDLLWPSLGTGKYLINGNGEKVSGSGQMHWKYSAHFEIHEVYHHACKLSLVISAKTLLQYY